MYQVDFSHPIHVHFIGIGGISMSGLAKVLLSRGFSVSGSDAKASPLTDDLAKSGATIYIGQRSSNIKPGTDLVVYTAAIHPDNPEYAAAVSAGVPMLTRAELLGQLMKNYPVGIAVAGTHGKTTTTSMLSCILLAARKDPTISIGGILPVIGGNIRIGGPEVFLAEACEYTNSFLSLHPTLGIILNIEPDHLDFFKNIDDIRSSFAAFAALLPPEGTLVINADIEEAEALTAPLSCHVLTYGTKEGADFTASDVAFDQEGCASFTALKAGSPFVSCQLHVPGAHNVQNALAAIAAASSLGIPAEAMAEGLGAFKGTERRFEYKGKVGETVIIDDYAHHPTEIAATLAAAHNYPHREIWCVFQPHTYSRTKSFLPDFAHALSRADHVVLAPIYAAREIDDHTVSSLDIKRLIEEQGTACEYFDTFDEIEAFLLSSLSPGDLLITMGAGDVYKIGDHLLGR